MPTAEEALKHIQSHNSRNRPTLPHVIKQVVNGPTIKIFNIYDKSHLVSLGSLGTFYIPPCEQGQEYSTPLEIKAAYIDEYPYDMDLNGIKTTYNMVDGADVAKEVVGTSAHKEYWRPSP
jgi:hypothetical protein